jgi:hypothetical protein
MYPYFGDDCSIGMRERRGESEKERERERKRKKGGRARVG